MLSISIITKGYVACLSFVVNRTFDVSFTIGTCFITAEIRVTVLRECKIKTLSFLKVFSLQLGVQLTNSH